MTLSPGARLGPYEIVDAIGAGGMGEVYKARDTRLDRSVAIKILLPDVSADPDRRARFEREAKTIAGLNHPHICTLHDVGEHDGSTYLVMEHIAGQTLAQRLEKGPLPLEQALAVATEIADALTAAHRQGIIHRDLKPGNVMLTKSGAKLLDFGLAKLTGHGERPAATGLTTASTRATPLTGEGAIMGTLQYMAPEQLEGRPADPRTDLWALGTLLFEMITGRRAFEGQSAASLIGAILEREPQPLPALVPLTPPGVDRLVRQCLAKSPDDRPDTAHDVASHLRWMRETSGAGLAPRELPPLKPRRRWSPQIALALAAALVLGGFAGLAVSSLRRVPTVDRAIRFSLNPPEGGRFVFANLVGGIALSPDGSTLAYVASVGGKTGLWVRSMEGGSPRLLPGTEDLVGYPFWSPDSRSIAFFTSNRLLRTELAGGAPLTVCSVVAGRGGTWTDDHRILFGTLAAGVFWVPDSNGTPKPLTVAGVARGETSHRWPQALPGGHFLYWAQGKREAQGIYAASLANPADARLLVSTEASGFYAPGVAGGGYLLYPRGEALVARRFDPGTLTLGGEPQMLAEAVTSNGLVGILNATASSGGLLVYSTFKTLSQFAWVDRQGAPLSTVAEPGGYGSFGLSVDGHRLAVARDRPGGSDIWLMDLDRGVPSQLTVQSDNAIYPVWSPDNRTVLFTPAPPRNLYRKDSSGTGDEYRLTQSPNIQYAMDWSQDGRSVLYCEYGVGTMRDLWVLPMSPEGRAATDAQPRPYLRSPSDEFQGRFSPEPNPRWVAYQSNESGGRNEVYVDTFPQPLGRVRISTSGGAYPRWGAGGRELFYMSPDRKLMVADLKVVGTTIEPSTPRIVFPLPIAEAAYCPYEPSPDGKRFLIRTTPETGASQSLTAVVNWQALLKEEKK